jgi:hypothetical protein
LEIQEVEKVNHADMVMSIIFGSVFLGLIVLYFVLSFFLYWWPFRREVVEKEEVPEYEAEPLFIYIRQGKKGMETYINERIKFLPQPYKEQIKAFMMELVRELEVKPEMPLGQMPRIKK